MSEAELHVLKQHPVRAVRAKPRRGEFPFRLPPGFVWDPAGRMVKTPDEQVQSAIGTIFEGFTSGHDDPNLPGFAWRNHGIQTIS